MLYEEIPSDDAVVEALAGLGGQATALALCDALVAADYPRRDSQLAIQRAAERGRIEVQTDWTLRQVVEEVAA